MSEATFKAHLNDLKTVFGLLQTDFETGPKRDLVSWYDEMLNDIYDSEDAIEDIINSRNNYDADSIDDFATVEDYAGSVQEGVNYSLENEDALDIESDSEDLDQNVEDDSTSEIDYDNSEDIIEEKNDDINEDIDFDEDTNSAENLVESTASNTNKPTIIKIIIN